MFENHNKAEDAVVREAAAVIKLYRDVNSYPAECGPIFSACWTAMSTR